MAISIGTSKGCDVKVLISVSLILSLLILQPGRGQGQSHPERHHVGKTATSPYQSSIDGVGAVRFWYSLPQPTMPAFERRKTLLPTLLRKKLKFHVYKNPTSSRWVIFNPGIFGHLSAPYVKYMIKTLHNLDYNVLAIPNSFTSSFLKSDPKFKPGDIFKESQVVCGLLRDFSSNNETPPSFEIFGVSYGGLLSSAVASQCSDIITRLTVVSPPLDLTKTLSILNRMILEMKENPRTFERTIQTPDWLLFSLAKMGFGENYHKLFAKFFYRGLAYSIRNHYRYSSDANAGFKNSIGNLVYDSKDYNDWEFTLDFHQFFSGESSSQGTRLKDSRKIQYWLEKLETQGVPFSILSSQDDPINLPQDWEPVVAAFSSQRIQVLEVGGHLGLTTTPLFTNFLRQRFL